MSISSLTRKITEPFTYADGNLIGQSSGGQTWEAISGGLPSLTISSGTAQTNATPGSQTGAALRSASLPDKWGNGFQVQFDLKTDSLTLGHNHFDVIFGAYAAPGSKQVVVYFNSAWLNTANLDILDNIHVENIGGTGDTYTNLIPFTQNVTHNVVITFTPNSLTTTLGVLTVSIDGVQVVNNAVDFAGVTDGIFLIQGVPTTASRWTIDNLVITSTYPVGRATPSGVAVFPQGAAGPNRVVGYRTYNAPSTLQPTNHTALFDLGTLVDNLTIANPIDDGTGFVESQRLEVLFQTSTGGMTLSFGNKYKFGQGYPSFQSVVDVVALASQNVRILFEYDSALAAYVCTRLVWGF